MKINVFIYIQFVHTYVQNMATRALYKKYGTSWLIYIYKNATSWLIYITIYKSLGPPSALPVSSPKSIFLFFELEEARACFVLGDESVSGT